MVLFREAANLVDGHLPAGPYDLILVGDGGPARYELEIEGLRGSLILDDGEPTPASIKTIHSDPSSSTNGKFFSGGAVFPSEETDGFSFLALWWMGEGHTTSGYGICNYEQDTQVPPGPLAFGPGCPTADDRPTAYNMPSGDIPKGFVFVYDTAQLMQAMGGWYATDTAVSNGGGVALSLPVYD